MEEKLRKLNYELDAITKSMADYVLFSEVVEDMRREIKKRILALNSIDGAMLEKGFDQGVLDEAKRLGGERSELATEREREMRERSTESMVRRADVLHDILELENKMRRNGHVLSSKAVEGVHRLQRLRLPVSRT